jgi:ribosomal protein S18 acetylase RimI-like enzyme
MVGPLAYVLEREPDFFALSAIQGEGGRVAVVPDRDPVDLAAVGTVALQDVWFCGEIRRGAYAGDLKVRPERRGEGHAGRIFRFLLDQVGSELDFGFGLILSGNETMAPIVAARDQPLRYERLATLRNFSLFFGRRQGTVPGVTVRACTDADIPALVDLWNRQGRGRDLTPVWTEAAWRARLARTPGLRLADYRVAFRGGDLAGFAAAWDARPCKQLRLVRLSGALAWVRRAYDPVARALGRATIPADGDLVPFLYVYQACAVDARVLQGLLARIHDDFAGPTYVYLDLALDRADPLLPAVSRFWRTHVDFDVFAQVPRARPPLARSGRPVHIDIALV